MYLFELKRVKDKTKVEVSPVKSMLKTSPIKENKIVKKKEIDLNINQNANVQKIQLENRSIL